MANPSVRIHGIPQQLKAISRTKAKIHLQLNILTLMKKIEEQKKLYKELDIV